MMGRESSLQDSVLSYLNKLPGCMAENVSGNANQSGRPDITGCYHGQMFKLELKSPDDGNTTTLKQDIELRRWATAGCVVGVVYSMKALRKMFEWDWKVMRGYGRYNLRHSNGCVSWLLVPKR